MTGWQTFWYALGGTATAVSALGALFAYIIQHRLNLRLADYNAQLSKNLTTLSNELQRNSKRQEIEFSWLHAKRAETIAELYGRLATVDYMLTKLLAQEGVKTQMVTSEKAEYIKSEVAKFAEETANLIEEIAERVLSTLIYFETDSATHLLRVTAYLRKLSLLHLHKADLLQNVTKAQLSDAKATEAIHDTRKYLPETKNVLEGEFRRLLGVENTTRKVEQARG